MLKIFTTFKHVTVTIIAPQPPSVDTTSDYYWKFSRLPNKDFAAFESSLSKSGKSFVRQGFSLLNPETRQRLAEREFPKQEPDCRHAPPPLSVCVISLKKHPRNTSGDDAKANPPHSGKQKPTKLHVIWSEAEDDVPNPYSLPASINTIYELALPQYP